MPGPNSADTERGASDTAQSGEFAAIERLAAALGSAGARLVPGEVGIGDDAAVLIPSRRHLMVTTDLTVEGVHFDSVLVASADVGWRAVAVAVSDIAAMGGAPTHVVVALAGPADTDVDGIYAGIGEASKSFGCPVVGGDLSQSVRLTLAVTVIGAVDDGSDPVLRSGARPGDRLWVTGPVGGAAAGLRMLRARPDASGPAVDAHRRPRPRLAEGRVARLAGATAMIDVSDGLLADVGRLAAASGVGFRLDDVPAAPGAALEEALAGGDDYELVFAVPTTEFATDGELEEMFARAGLSRPFPIGECVLEVGARTLWGEEVALVGWEHSFVGPARPAGTTTAMPDEEAHR